MEKEPYIKIYGWTAQMPYYERLIFSLIYQYTVSGKEIPGYWAGYKTMSKMVGTPKSKCKAIVEDLLARGQIHMRHETIGGKTRQVFTIVPEVVALLKPATHTRARIVNNNI